MMRPEYVEAARALGRFVTSRAKKRTAAILLRSLAAEKPHCKFCETGRAWFVGSQEARLGVDLHESPYDPTVWICGHCAWYIAFGREILKRKVDEWTRLKGFAP